MAKIKNNRLKTILSYILIILGLFYIVIFFIYLFRIILCFILRNGYFMDTLHLLLKQVSLFWKCTSLSFFSLLLFYVTLFFHPVCL